MSNPTRKAAVRGLFYPQECSEVRATFQNYDLKLQQVNIPQEIQNIVPRAIVVPHAGYIYSGFTASFAYRFLQKSNTKRVIVIGPSHHHYFKGISGSYYEKYETPCGDIDIDSAYLFALAKQFDICAKSRTLINLASIPEKMPFIKAYLPKAEIIELIYGDMNPKSIANLILALLKNPENTVVISSDLSHFHTLDVAKKYDYHCLKAVEKLDTELLKEGCEASGIIGIEAMIMVAKQLNFSSKLLDYRTSADASRDEISVVGYLSAMFYE